MKKIFIVMLICLASSCHRQAIEIKSYPATKKGEVAENYFGVTVADPYRWLEDDRSAETADWVKAQNEVTESYFTRVPFRDEVRKRLTEIWNYPRYGSPFREGEYYYFFKNDGLQNQSALYRMKSLDDQPELFLDPNTLSAEGTVALKAIGFSKDHRYMAYSISKDGSDWEEIFVKDTKTGEMLPDHLQWLKFTGITWQGNGFYYSRYDEPTKATELTAQNQFQKVYYHRMGTPQTADQLVFEDREHPLRYFSADVTEDEAYLIIYASEGTSGTELYVRNLTDPHGKLSLLVKGFAYNYSVVDHADKRLLVLTDHSAPNYRLTSIDPANPDSSQWIDVIPETVELLEGVTTGGGKLFAFYLKDASSRVLQLDYNGHVEHEIKLPAIGSASGLAAKHDEQTLFYSFTNFTTPPSVYRYDVASGQSTLYRQPETKFNPDEYETQQVFYDSKDGTHVHMFIVSKKGIELNGKNPTLLYGYGGFNISMTPGFSISNMAFIEKGGVYAVANIRGGGEYGEEWHRGGMLGNKQNVFDDFIAAAEYLIAQGYTSPDRLAIRGGSNGGLLVGAAMTQRPDLFRVALPAVGVMDMLRFQKFTCGWGWVVEYGTSDREEDFNWLIAYSPLHNLRKGVKYPATLITTADHDDRVVPAHSFKFAATLQEMNGSKYPTLIRIETNAGHGAGKPVSKAIDEATDIWSFVFQELGMITTPQK